VEEEKQHEIEKLLIVFMWIQNHPCINQASSQAADRLA
jgi:hypothetical protein